MQKKIKSIEQLKSAIVPHHQRLQSHPIYGAVKNMQDQKIFMQSHVFAVFDFMTLLKAIQMKVTSVQVPWIPPLNRQAAYLINSIVCGEESDDLDTGDANQAISHYELYLKAMADIGSDSSAIELLISHLRKGTNWNTAVQQVQLSHPEIPENTFKFIQCTHKLASTGGVHEIASSFLYGREDPIPKMFQQFLENIRDKKMNLPNFQKYLERHIELDGDHHSHMAEDMLSELIGGDELKYQQAFQAAVDAIQQREMLWEGIYQKIQVPKKESKIGMQIVL